MPRGKLVRKLHVRMDRSGAGSTDHFLPTTVRLQSDACERISEITLDSMHIYYNSLANQIHTSVRLENAVVRLAGENLAFNYLSNVVEPGDVVDGAVFAVVQTRGDAHDPFTLMLFKHFDEADKPHCRVVPPAPLKQLKIEVTKVDHVKEIEIGSQNAVIDLEFSLYSEASVA